MRLFDQKSKAAQHANTHNRSFDFENVRIVTREQNYHKTIFLESWFTVAEKNPGNDHGDIPEIYESLSNPLNID